MNRVRRFFSLSVGDSWLDAHLGEIGSYLAALILFFVGLERAPAVADTPFELLVGTFLTLSLCVLLVVLGRLSAFAPLLQERKALRNRSSAGPDPGQP